MESSQPEDPNALLKFYLNVKGQVKVRLKVKVDFSPYRLPRPRDSCKPKPRQGAIEGMTKIPCKSGLMLSTGQGQGQAMSSRYENIARM